MKKKLLTMILIVSLSFGLVACGQKDKDVPQEPAQNAEKQEEVVAEKQEEVIAETETEQEEVQEETVEVEEIEIQKVEGEIVDGVIWALLDNDIYALIDMEGNVVYETPEENCKISGIDNGVTAFETDKGVYVISTSGEELYVDETDGGQIAARADDGAVFIVTEASGFDGTAKLNVYIPNKGLSDDITDPDNIGSIASENVYMNISDGVYTSFGYITVNTNTSSIISSLGKYIEKKSDGRILDDERNRYDFSTVDWSKVSVEEDCEDVWSQALVEEFEWNVSPASSADGLEHRYYVHDSYILDCVGDYFSLEAVALCDLDKNKLFDLADWWKNSNNLERLSDEWYTTISGDYFVTLASGNDDQPYVLQYKLNGEQAYEPFLVESQSMGFVTMVEGWVFLEDGTILSPEGTVFHVGDDLSEAKGVTTSTRNYQDLGRNNFTFELSDGYCNYDGQLYSVDGSQITVAKVVK